MKGYDDEQVMLTLALLTYRGFYRPGTLDWLDPAKIRDRMLQLSVAEGLRDMPTLGREWRLVWGPATFRLPFTLFDDAAMYVASSTRGPTRYAIAVRGTNPASIYDWLYGDFLVGTPVPWRYGYHTPEPSAAISLSTAFGLSAIQHMRADVPEEDEPDGLWGFFDDVVVDRLREAAHWALRPLELATSRALRGVRKELLAKLGELDELRAGLDGLEPAQRVQRLLDAWESDTQQRVLTLLVDAIAALGDDRPFDLARLLEGGVKLRARLDTGQDVRGFLRGVVEREGGPLDIFVTGHSKGGAMAPTVALWLAETQGQGPVPEDERWDPERRATIHSYAFAGPTPGNAAFARRFDRTLGERGHRIANFLDVVPHAWTVEELGQVPGLYGDDILGGELLERLAEVVLPRIGGLGHQHVGRDVRVFPGQLATSQRDLFTQIVHQHVQGYIDGTGLADELDLIRVMSPA